LVEQAQAIDKENGNTLWWDAILMEMKNICPTFEKWEKGENELHKAWDDSRITHF
jgi:hypothetical protein